MIEGVNSQESQGVRRGGSKRILMTVLLIVSDSISIILSGLTALFIWSLVRADLFLTVYDELLPAILIFLVVFWLVGLYPATGINPVDEFRWLTITTTVVFLVLATISFYVRNVEVWSRAAFFIAWFISMALIPFGRHITRMLAVKLDLWGEPVAIIGFGPQGRRLFNTMRNNPRLGYKPSIVIHAGSDDVEVPEDVRFLNTFDLYEIRETMSGLVTAITVPSELPEDLQKAIKEDYFLNIPHLILVYPDIISNNLWFSPLDIGGTIGLKIHKNLLIRKQQILKRLSDLVLILLASPFIIPLFFLISLLILLDSPGPTFYRQKRVGRKGKQISIVKFRTMIPDADKILAQYLLDNPASKQEYEVFKKLRNDPRITRVGRVLRRLSLDELPQLWNVLMGEMSLVGPRPILFEEVEEYGEPYKTYIQVKPGLTGLWQVSGRNELSYQQRVRMDRYYVYNWSIWLDIYILIKTVIILLSAKGAY